MIEELKHSSNMVLPTVYDDALSYAEALGKVVIYLNEVIDQINLQKDYLETGVDRIEKIEENGLQTINLKMLEVNGALETINDKVSQAQLQAVSAQLADIENEKFVIKNDVLNGDFSNGALGFNLIGCSVIDNEVRILRETSNQGYFTPNLNLVVGDVYFIAYQSRSVSGYTIYNGVYNGSTRIASLSNTAINALSTKKFTAINTKIFFGIYGFNHICHSYYDDIILINLTKSGIGDFTEDELRRIIKLVGYFEGEYNLNQREALSLVLSLIRENRNAIIALGGTII